MAKTLEKQKALAMRADGMSYSQIKETLRVSKGSLSLWLREYPLSVERIAELRGKNPRRIERFQNTMRAKREAAFSSTFEKVSKDIGPLTKRDLLIGGIFLYWGEGQKSAEYTTSVSNTDPHVLKAFIQWLSLFDVDRESLKVTLHLYKDMDEQAELAYWSKELRLPLSCFRRSYIKDSTLSGLTYKNGFGHGTCNVRYYDKEMWLYSQSALKYIRQQSVL